MRTPYREIFKNFNGFSWVQVNNTEGQATVGDNANPCVWLLPPGKLHVMDMDKGEGNFSKHSSGEFVHTGGWFFMHPHNAIDISLISCSEIEDFEFNDLTKLESDESSSISGVEVGQL